MNQSVATENARIAIYGAGAMGTVLGALMTRGGVKGVDLITRNKAHIQGLKTNGAKLICTAEKKELTVPVSALLPNEMQGQYDVIFLMTKQKNNGEILQFLLPFLKSDGVVVTTQNGLPEESVAEVVGKERTYGGVASFGANFIGEGVVELTSQFDGMGIQVSGYENGNEKLPLLLEILTLAGKAVANEHFARKSENLAGARWSKLAINSAFSGLSVVTGMPFGKVAKKKKTRKIALGILRECTSVANALGVELEKMQGHDMQKMLCGETPLKRFVAYLLLPFAMRKHKNLVSGMCKDVENGRKCEIDFIDGVVVKKGKEVGVATPLCEQVVEIVHGIENGLYETDYLNADFFEV